MLHRLVVLVLLLLAPSLARADFVMLLSDDKPGITSVGQEIAKRYRGRIETYNLQGDMSRAGEIAAAINASERQQVVAVGLLAAQLARQRLGAKQVVFCQVINYEEHDLVTEWMKGVSAVPSLQRQFHAWKLLSPELKKVGVVTGRYTRYLAEEAAAAGKASNIEVVRATAESDREAMFLVRQLLPRVQGLWVAPDSSVMNAQALREIIGQAVRQNVQVLTVSAALLKEGGLLSAVYNKEEVAKLVLARLKRAEGVQGMPGEAVTPLSTAVVTVNGAAAAQLGLAIDPRLREIADVQ